MTKKIALRWRGSGVSTECWSWVQERRWMIVVIGSFVAAYDGERLLLQHRDRPSESPQRAARRRRASSTKRRLRRIRRAGKIQPPLSGHRSAS